MYATKFSGSMHVHSCGPGSADEQAIWEYVASLRFMYLIWLSIYPVHSVTHVTGMSPGWTLKTVVGRWDSNCSESNNEVTQQNLGTSLDSVFTQVDHFRIAPNR